MKNTKKYFQIFICLIGLVSLASCGSTAPCGLAKSKEIKQQPKTNQTIINKVIV